MQIRRIAVYRWLWAQRVIYFHLLAYDSAEAVAHATIRPASVASSGFVQH